MKNFKFTIIILALAITSACDKIEGPYGSSGTIGPVGGDTVVQNVLLEDFTGHTCQACPNAHREASRLHGIYGERLIILAVHADFWAAPYPLGAPFFTYDFRNSISTQIATDFNVIGQPFPKGMVNRMLNPGTSNQLVFDWAGWESKIDQWANAVATAGLEITPGYNSGSNIMTAEVKVKAVSDLTDGAHLAVYFSEDNIVKWQKDGSINDSTYVHNHVLRGSFNGMLGEDLGVITAGDSLIKSYSASLAPADVVANKVHLVAILTNTVTKEVIQVTEVKLQ
ncbi:MAG: Omp28-related outer membrane protein [Bacteroidetes bacterium]|nr:Omp28-related outer membrane protein [Bacteroidota bacterium]